MVLEGLDDYVDSEDHEPSPAELTWWFFADKGISYLEFQDLPIPYIISVIRTQDYVQEKREERAESQKNSRSV